MGEYPENWKEIATAIKEAAGWKCECCGMEFDTRGQALTARRRDGKPHILTVHHLNEVKSDCRPENLVSLCQSCHYTIHVRNWQPGKPLPHLLAKYPAHWLVSRGVTVWRQEALI